MLRQYCLACHSTEKHKGDLDLERFATLADVRKEVKPWQAMVEQVEAGEMPPKGKPQPSDAERAALIGWVRAFLDSEAAARAGDPGFVPMRRLSNAEYDYTIRDLTGIDLRPAKQFPADGAAGEGFTNAAEALVDMSPTLLNKYLLAAKDIAAHAVLLPDGFRFSANKTRQDWSDEIVTSIKQFYAGFTSDGKLPLQPYLAATLTHRDAILAGKVTVEQVAASEHLNPKFLRHLWETLTAPTPSFSLDQIRASWRRGSEKDAGAITSEIAAMQARLWKIVPIGSYRNLIRQQPNDPPIGESQTVRFAVKPTAGQNDVVLYLRTRELFGSGADRDVIWGRPRFENAKAPPLLLRDYAQFGPAYEVNYAAVFADTAKYLSAVAEAAAPNTSAEAIATKAGLNADRLKRWIRVLAISSSDAPLDAATFTAAAPLELLAEKITQNGQKSAINGWKKKGADLPVVLSNSSDTEEHVPGRASPHKVIVHPTPTEFVAVAWKSPVTTTIKVAANISHAHPSCGNGVAFWLEHRIGDRAGVLAEGTIELGGEACVPPRLLEVSAGDLIVLAIDAKDGNHSCDLTEISLTISDATHLWDLSADVANNILDGNPRGVWTFVKGPTRAVAKNSAFTALIPAGSSLARWRTVVTDPARHEEAMKLAADVQTLLRGTRPTAEKDPNGILYDRLVTLDSPLLKGLDLSNFRLPTAAAGYGLDAKRFGARASGAPVDDASFTSPANSIVEIRLPAGLMRDREFVVDVKLGSATDRVAQFEVSATRPREDTAWDAPSWFATTPGCASQKQLLAGFEEFRRCFPMFICYPAIIPVDEIVCLKMYHREDEPLMRLFLDESQRQQLDRLWEQHRFITQQPVVENKYFPVFIGFVTQDQSKETLAYFEGMRGLFQKQAETFESQVEAAVPKQLELLLDFASRAYRRPLSNREKLDLRAMYAALRAKGVSSDDAFRGVLSRLLVAPSYLLRIEHAPPGKKPGSVNDFELASRLSYFLWASAPDDELRAVAVAGKLHDPATLATQTGRMLKDNRTRALAIEFGTQWIHVHGFDEFKEKSETLYPEFDEPLRAAIYEESILFFQDLFQQDEPVQHILDADYTYLNDTLAKHYGIPGVSGSTWRKVDGVRKYGRGGILGLASVQAKQAGAARTSPVLRGNWVVETLLGEKLPRPPPDVPRLPETEGTSNGLTMRQLVEQHTRVESCAVCHQRMDPLGFAFERYDSIGRWRDKESTGLPIDCRAKLKDETEFEGIDGLRNYLLTKKKDVIVRLFCRRLLGYALGRAVTLSDQPLIDSMVAALNKNDGKISAAVLEIVQSPQFRCIRGSAFVEGE